MKTIQIINAFEGITGTEVRDCIDDENRIYFLVNSGKAALAIGKGGKRVRVAEEILGKKIRVFEYDEDPKKLVKNLIPTAEKIEINGKCANVVINNRQRGAIIGKDGSNIKMLRELLGRNSDLEDLRIL